MWRVRGKKVSAPWCHAVQTQLLGTLCVEEDYAVLPTVGRHPQSCEESCQERAEMWLRGRHSSSALQEGKYPELERPAAVWNCQPVITSCHSVCRNMAQSAFPS